MCYLSKYMVTLNYNFSLFVFLDIGSNNSGYYDLKAVLTHQGRSSSSGHYVAWIRRDEGICFLWFYSQTKPHWDPKQL